MVSFSLTILHNDYIFSFNDSLTILIPTKLVEEAAVEGANLVQPLSYGTEIHTSAILIH
jgi:hypothetical protein